MKYCPGCEAEYQDSVKICPDCGGALVDEQAWSTIQAGRAVESSEVFVRAATAGDQFEADVIRDALEKERIPVLVRTFHDTSFDGIYQAQKGWGVIEVPREFLERAQAVISQLAAPSKT